MASMEDLVATIGGDLHVGQGNDLKELQNKLSQTLHPTKAPFRPIPPSSSSNLTASNANGNIPPAPASSWNDAFSNPTPSSSMSTMYTGGNLMSNGTVASPRNQRDLGPGSSIPPPKSQQQQVQGHQTSQNGIGRNRNNQGQAQAQVQGGGGGPGAEVDDGFRDDAFKPLWQAEAEAKGSGGGPIKPGWKGFDRK